MLGVAVRRWSVAVVLALAATGLAWIPVGAAPTWVSPAVPLSPVGDSSLQHQVVVNDAGVAIAMWLNMGVDETAFVVQASVRTVGGSWSVVDDVSATDGLAMEPQVAIDPAGNAVAVWQQLDAATPFIEASRRPAGGSWSEPVTISDTSASAMRPKVAVDDSGNAVAIWNSAGKVHWAALPVGGSWSVPQPFTSDLSEDHVQNDLTVTPAGVATAVWADSASGHEVITFTSRQPGGSWTTPAGLSTETEDAVAVDVSSSASGKTLVAWTLVGPDTSTPDPSDTRLLVQARVRADATAAWGLVTDLSEPGGTATFTAPRGAMDDIGRAAVVWSRLDTDLGHRVVETAKYTPEDAWTGRVDLSAPGVDAIRPDVALAGSGDVTAIWRNDDAAVIQTASRPTGLTGWGEPQDLTDGTPKAEDPRVASDQDGNAVAVWAELPGAPESRIVARGFDAAGPVISSMTVPQRGQAEKPVTMSLAAKDAWSPFSVVWKFGDGTQATGLTVKHTYAKRAVYKVTVTATDAVGNVSTKTDSIVVSDPVPRVSGLTLTKATIHVVSSRRLPRATQLKFRLNTAATVIIKLKRTEKLNGRIVTATRRVDRSAGQQSITLTSKVGRKRLPPGVYRVTVTAKNHIGTSAAKVVKLRIRR